MNAKPRVVIIGAGFGGLEAAKKLACEAVRVTVVDRTNYHLFQPLLYQVATAALSPADIAAPVRAILSKCKNMEVILAEVQSIDVNAKKVKMADGEVDLRSPLRAGAGDEEIADLFRLAVFHKPKEHRLEDGVAPISRNMSQLGG